MRSPERFLVTISVPTHTILHEPKIEFKKHYVKNHTGKMDSYIIKLRKKIDSARTQ